MVDFGLARALVDDADADEPGAGDLGAEPEANAGDAANAPNAGNAANAGNARNAGNAPNAGDLDLARGPTVVLGHAVAAGAGASLVPFTTGGETIDHEPAPPAGAPPATPGASQGDAASSAPKLKAALRLTETGAVMGTPSFMAPEQMRGAVADLRSDQFSFCVALYHALYDTFPFSGRSLRELRDSMQNDEVAFAAGVPVPASVRKALHRGLSVDPSQRFPSMAELLAALSPRSRRRGWIAAAVGLAAVAAAAVLALSSQSVDPCATAGAGIDTAWSIDRQVLMRVAFLRGGQPFAESAWRGVKDRVDGYAQRWRDGATAACQATHVAHTQSAQQLDQRMLCLDRGRRQLAALVAELGSGAGDAVEHAVEAAGALPELDACSRAENLLFGVAPPPPALAAAVAAARDQLAQARTLELLGRYDESLAIARQVSTTTERLAYPAVHAEALVQVARALDVRGTLETRTEAQRRYFDALTIAEAERHDQLTSEIWIKLVTLAVRMDSSMAQAHEWWTQAFAWSRRNAPTDHDIGDGAKEVAELHYLLGQIYIRESEYIRAVDEERRAISVISGARIRPLELSRYYVALANSLDRLDARDEAMQLHERALAIATEALGARHPKVILLQINYGRVLGKYGRTGEARSVLQAALGSMIPRYRDAHPDAARIHTLLSELDFDDGELDRAAEHARASLEIYERTLSPEHVSIAEANIELGNVELMRRNFTEALTLFQRALELRRRHLGGNHYNVGLTEVSVAEALVYLERYDDAMTHLVEGERICQRGSGHERATQAWMLTVRGEILAGRRAFVAAVPVLERALGMFHGDAADRVNQAVAMWTLARAFHELGKESGRVRSLAERAHTIFSGLRAVGAHDRDAVSRFLARLPQQDSSRPLRPATDAHTAGSRP
ncbi:MAG TPA: tetratricopeptide repeat-containing protein kinase family protein [Kofleriaceae bacterium]